MYDLTFPTISIPKDEIRQSLLALGESFKTSQIQIELISSDVEKIAHAATTPSIHAIQAANLHRAKKGRDFKIFFQGILIAIPVGST
jgi:hypothetical protein